MLIFQGISPQGSAKVGRVVTIGNFDGVHCGHQALIQETCAIANREGLTATAVTFAPHPKAFFAPEKAPGKIQGLRGKAAALSELGIQELWILRFRATLAEMPAQRFIRDFLYQSLHAKHIVVGDDFRFGAKRQGDFAMLLEAGAANNWQAHRVEAVSVDGERASSSTLRDALARGNLRRAESLMGRPYTLCGHVIHGKKTRAWTRFSHLEYSRRRSARREWRVCCSREGAGLLTNRGGCKPRATTHHRIPRQATA